MSAPELIKQARSFGAELVPMSGTLRIRTQRPLPDGLIAELRAHKADVLAALTPSQTLTATKHGVSHWRLPDDREAWTSFTEPAEWIQTRHPGAVPWTDAQPVTFTELLPDGRRQLS